MEKTLEVKPTKALFDLDIGVSRLWFPPESLAPDGHYVMAGGICWPILCKDVFIGAALLAGRFLDGTIYVFEQREFSSVDPVYTNKHELISEGLAPWFTHNWATYYALRYYWFQHDAYAHTFRRQVRHNDMIEPKPRLIETHWSDDAHADLVISDVLEQRKLKFRRGSPVYDQLEQKQADPDSGPFPAIHALACLLTGLARKRTPEV